VIGLWRSFVTMKSIGTDLVLLAVDPGSGRLRMESNLRYGLMGAELVALTSAGLVEIQQDRLLATQISPSSTGDAELDAAMASIADSSRPQRPAVWVRRPRRGIVDAYLAKLAAAGAIAPSGGRGRWRIADEARAASARARLDAIAYGSGPVDAADATLAGLAYAVGLQQVLYKGSGWRAVHRRLREVAQGQWTAAAVHQAVSGAANATAMAAQAAQQAATQAAMQAAMQAATDAALQATLNATAAGMPPL
jgi:Golgi phosphoprotein 3 (GPP34)